MIFFFQAEDGIREAQKSRGLGVMYMRPKRGWGGVSVRLNVSVLSSVCWPVADTHLTLPTNREV